MKLGDKEESCHQLKIVANLSEQEVRSMDNNLFYETMEKVREAKELIQSRQCE